MKLIFCDSFSYASLSDRAECISFPMPVVISGVRVVADKATAHASLPTPAYAAILLLRTSPEPSVNLARWAFA